MMLRATIAGFPSRDHYNLSFSGAATAVFLILVVRYFNSPWRKLPPGPPGLHILGNALEICGPFWEKFVDWRRTFGDVFSWNAMGYPIVVVNCL
ncbi:hypothetical protein FA95DRAFT_1605924 [Auriscalpium vulgare]|uniref:Uncharacterized protein n=1 Tax=Auriscalpium vulgare TaxID=40419 RepID=A0ACB8RTU8_9AGAM|nr:hypothetical protein FA95DRAFT_1605924 [Auriscalpium vulgare]